MSLNPDVSYIFYATDLLATKLGVLIYCYSNKAKYNKVGVYWRL